MRMYPSLVVALAATLSVSVSPSFARSPLVAVGDADMAPTAYVNNRLDPRVGGAVDRLLTVEPRSGLVRSVPVTNAVTGPALSVDKSSDGRLAVVVEAAGPAPAGATRFDQLPTGRQVTLVRLRPRSRPTVLDRATVSPSPTSASFSPNGRYVLVTSGNQRRPVTLFEVDRAGFGGRQDLRLTAPGGPRIAPSRAVSADWRPDGRRFAVTLQARDEVVFYAFRTRRGRPRVRFAGGPVELESRVFGGFYTPDGRTFITNNVPQVAVPEPGTVPNPEDFFGWLSVLDVTSTPRVVQTVRTPIFDEGLTISPDGRRVATVSLQVTPLEPTHPLFSPLSVVSLWRLDRASQRLTKLSDAQFEGLLPEGIDFDPSGRRLAVATYQRNWINLTTEGSVDLWRLDPGRSRATLERRVPTMRGVHSVAWAR